MKAPFWLLNQPRSKSNYSLLEAEQRLEIGMKAIRLLFPQLAILKNQFGTSGQITVEKPFEEQFKQYSNAVGVNWTTEEFSQGGYSYFSIAQTHLFTEDQIVESLGQKVFRIFEPILPSTGDGKCRVCGLYFAGEHTATQGTPATMEGAVHSGNKVGQQIPARLKTVGE